MIRYAAEIEALKYDKVSEVSKPPAEENEEERSKIEKRRRSTVSTATVGKNNGDGWDPIREE
jgi:hypothetical protein